MPVEWRTFRFPVRSMTPKSSRSSALAAIAFMGAVPVVLAAPPKPAPPTRVPGIEHVHATTLANGMKVTGNR